MSAALLEVRDLSLAVAGRRLVDRLNLAVHAGEMWCLLGPNGSGKTTFLHTVVGLREAQSGSICLQGRPLSGWKPLDAARQRGFLPQAIHDAFGASVLDCVMMGRHPHLGRWQWEGEAERAMALSFLETVDLAGFADRDVMTLSGGERQRVAIAALLAQETPLLLLSHLSELSRDQGRGLLFSMHDLNLASRHASHAVILEPGGSATLGPVEEVMTEAILSNAFGHRLTRVEHAGRILFIPE